MAKGNQFTFAINAEIWLTVADANLPAARAQAEAIFMKHLRGGGIDLAEPPPGATSARVLVDDGSMLDCIDDE